MSEMTPQTLDAIADQLGNAGYGSWALAIEAHAAAWEADRQRLEAAEKVIQEHDRQVTEDGHYCSVLGEKVLSALAEEEKP